MQTSGAMRREMANLYPVVVPREGGRSSIPETSVDRTDKPRRTGSPAFAGDDDLFCGSAIRATNAASNPTTPASTRQRNSGESGGGESSGVQPVSFSSA